MPTSWDYNKSPVKNLTRPDSKSLLILGNGKSLAKYPFHKYNVDTVGISQAFRYWRKIGWYPTYYVCLDRNINRTFARQIKHLVMNRKYNKIKRFFLTTEILKKYPKLRKISCVHFVEYVNKSKHRGFSGDTLITSGSFAVRFGIYLGYQKIHLLGIDAQYKPIDVKWIRKVCNANQRLKRTINPEPDYFFVGYRAKGDYLHIPPRRRWKSRTNHLLTFRRLAREFNYGRTQPQIINCNPISALTKAGIIPLQPVPDSWTDYLKPETSSPSTTADADSPPPADTKTPSPTTSSPTESSPPKEHPENQNIYSKSSPTTK